MEVKRLLDRSEKRLNPPGAPLPPQASIPYKSKIPWRNEGISKNAMDQDYPKRCDHEKEKSKKGT